MKSWSRRLTPILMWTCVAEVGALLLLEGVLIIKSARQTGWLSGLPLVLMLAAGCGWFICVVAQTRDLARQESQGW